MNSKLKSIYILSAITVTILFIELSTRLIGLGYPPLLVKDKDIGYLFAANQDLKRFGNHVYINQWHQRSKNLDPSMLPEHRILCIGDSVTFGSVLLDQSEPYPARLEQELPGSRVLNASAGGWGLGNEMAYLKKFGTFKSQWVIMQIGSTDLLQPMAPSSWVGSSPDAPEHNPPCAIAELWSRYLYPRIFHQRAELLNEAPAISSEKSFVQNMIWFEEGVRFARVSGSKVFVLHTPDRDEVVSSASRDLEAEVTDYSPYRIRFLTICKQMGVPLLDLTKEWKNDPKAALWFRDGIHLSVAGASEVGIRIARDLKMLELH